MVNPRGIRKIQKNGFTCGAGVQVNILKVIQRPEFCLLVLRKRRWEQHFNLHNHISPCPRLPRLTHTQSRTPKFLTRVCRAWAGALDDLSVDGSEQSSPSTQRFYQTKSDK